MKKIKVLHVVGQLMLGGQETMVMNFCRYADRSKIEFDFLVYGKEIGDFEQEANSMGGKVIHTPALKEIGYRSFSKQINNIIEKNGPYDAIHCHTSLNSGVLLKISKKHAIPVRIAHSHTTNPGKKLTYTFKVYSSLMRRTILNNATHFVGCGKDAGNYLFGEKTFTSKGFVINNGILVEKFKVNSQVRDRIRKELSLGDSFVVGHVGRLSEEKNHIFLLNIFKEILNKNSNSKLVLIGDGPLKKALIEQSIKMDIEEKVVFCGQRNDISEVLQSMDVFVFPSLYEGLPVSVVEAQASGLPCILSNNITSEIKITSLTKFMSLDLSAEEWADAVIDKKVHSRLDVSEDIRKSGYDIRDVCQKLQKIYMGEKIIEAK